MWSVIWTMTLHTSVPVWNTKEVTNYGPTIRRRQLAMELTELRKAAGLIAPVAADALGCAASRISHLERGRSLPTKADLDVLLRLYGASDKFAVLEEIRVAATERGWWSTYRLPSWLAAYISLESESVRLRRWILELVPGMLQTEPYARQGFVRHGVGATESERNVAARMERAARLARGELQMSVVMSEALLHRTAAMNGVGGGQLRHLRQAAELPNVSLRVLPFSVGGHLSMSTSFTILDFPDDVIGPVGYQEAGGASTLVDDQRVVQLLVGNYEALSDQALGEDETRGWIDRFIEQAEGRSNGV